MNEVGATWSIADVALRWRWW